MVHGIFDILALLAAVGVAKWFRDSHGLSLPIGIRDVGQQRFYLIFLLLGLSLGSLAFGSWNHWLSGGEGFAKSILGGIFGAVVVAEVFKHFSRIRRSTGLYFVPGLVTLVAVGRIGCFLSGLEDNTHGVATDLPWGVDFGDGVLRHPVQLYESIVMVLFFIFLLIDYPRRPRIWQQQGFYWFVLVYALQRFVWEYLKPYPNLLFGLNLFHWLCLALVVYGLWMMKYGVTDSE